MGFITRPAKIAKQTAEAQQRAEATRQANIRQGTANINNAFDSQFTPDFYNAQRQGYLDYAMPQLGQQYADASKKLAYSLDRAGLTNSSVRAQKEGELSRLYDTNSRSIADQAQGYANDARSNAEASRADLISTLNATGDAVAATNAAIGRARTLAQPPTYSPLSQLFASFTDALGTQANLERAAQLSGGAISPTYQTGLFAPRRSAASIA